MRNGADLTARNIAEQKIQQALAYLTEELRTGKKANISHASKLFGCPFTTLRCRWNGDRRSLKEANEGKQLLSPSQEDTIINYFNKHPRLRDSPVYSPLFNPSRRSGAQAAQQTAAIPTPSASQQPAVADSSRQPLGNISHSSLTNVALSHPCFAVPHTSPPHLQLQPPLQSNLQYNNFNSTISHPLNLHYTQYPSYLP